jgi:hypothetical protein
MHHSLRLYSKHRQGVLKFYMFGAKMTRIPLIGRLVRWVANAYGRNMEGAYLLTTDEAELIVDIARGVAVGRCDCRDVFKNCDNPLDAEILLGPTRHIFMEHMPHDSREITKKEAKGILRDCHRRGLVHSMIKCKNDFYAICNCCTCCCVPLRMIKLYGIGDALSRKEDIVQEFKEYVSHYEKADRRI